MLTPAWREGGPEVGEDPSDPTSPAQGAPSAVTGWGGDLELPATPRVRGAGPRSLQPSKEDFEIPGAKSFVLVVSLLLFFCGEANVSDLLPQPSSDSGHVLEALSLSLVRNLRGHRGQACSIQINHPSP